VLIIRHLERADGPVPVARMAHFVRIEFPDLVGPYNWLGSRTFTSSSIPSPSKA
jgi:hypothetical protein